MKRDLDLLAPKMVVHAFFFAGSFGHLDPLV